MMCFWFILHAVSVQQMTASGDGWGYSPPNMRGSSSRELSDDAEAAPVPPPVARPPSRPPSSKPGPPPPPPLMGTSGRRLRLKSASMAAAPRGQQLV